MKGTQTQAAVVLAAGKGTRMMTDLPKVAVPVLGKAMLVHVLDHLAAAGVTRVVLVVGYGREVVQDLVKDRTDLDIQFAVQEVQKGTAHAFLCAEPNLKDFTGPVMVTCGDMPVIRPSTFRSLLAKHELENAGGTVLSAVLENPKGYGRLVRNSSGQLLKIVEEKDADDETRKIKETNSGTYVFNSPEIFSILKQIDTNNKQGEYYLPDAIGLLNARGQKVSVAFTENPDEALGANSPDDIQLIEKRMQLAGAT